MNLDLDSIIGMLSIFFVTIKTDYLNLSWPQVHIVDNSGFSLAYVLSFLLMIAVQISVCSGSPQSLTSHPATLDHADRLSQKANILFCQDFFDKICSI